MTVGLILPAGSVVITDAQMLVRHPANCVRCGYPAVRRDGHASFCGSTSAAPDASHVPANVVEAPGTGAVRPSPRDDTAVRGSTAPSSARVPNGTSRRTAPTTTKAPGVSAPRASNSAAR